MVVMWFSEILTDLDEKENEETGLLKPARNKRQIKGKRNKRPRYSNYLLEEELGDQGMANLT